MGLSLQVVVGTSLLTMMVATILVGLMTSAVGELLLLFCGKVAVPRKSLAAEVATACLPPCLRAHTRCVRSLLAYKTLAYAHSPRSALQAGDVCAVRPAARRRRLPG